MPSLADRQFVSRYSSPVLALRIYEEGQPWSAYDAVTASYFDVVLGDRADEPRWSRTVDPSSPGLYEVTLSSADTQTIGEYEIMFTYELDGPQVYGYDLEVGPQAPYFDSLPSDWQGIVEGVWMLFSDLYDSPYGGPNLQVYIQTNFGRNRLAQLLPDALQVLNSATLGHTTYSVGDSFPFSEWGPLLRRSLYIEVLKHLIRSYTEQPEVIPGSTVSRVDRRDYTNRWREVLDMELRTFDRDLSRYKIANIGLGNVHVLVSGGAFGKMGPFVNAGGSGAAAARGYFVTHRMH